MNGNSDSPNSALSTRLSEAERNDAMRKENLVKIRRLCTIVNGAFSDEKHSAQPHAWVKQIIRTYTWALGFIMPYKTDINPGLLQCKKLSVLDGCKKTCGVLSPLEFAHEEIRFVNMRERRDADRKYVFNLAVAAELAPQRIFPESFHSACLEIASGNVDRIGIAAAFIISALATASQGKVLFTEHQQKKLTRFFPLAITEPQYKGEMQEILDKAFQPLLEYQRGLAEGISGTDVARKKEIARLRRQLKKEVTGSKDYKELGAKLKRLLTMPKEKRLLIEKYTPMKFFKQIMEHPESCGIVDPEGNFFQELQKNTRGTNDVARFMAPVKTAASIQFEDQYGQRYRAPQRDFFYAGVATYKEFYSLHALRRKSFRNLINSLFPITDGLSPPPVAAQSAERYSERMAAIIRTVQLMEPITHSVTSHSFCPVFGQDGCPPEFRLLCNMLNVYITLYEKGPHSLVNNELAGACFAQALLNSRNHFQNAPPVNAAFSVATRIKKFLLRRKLRYFRLRLLQHDVLSNLKKTDIQKAIDWMIDEGDIAEVHPQFDIPNGERAGQLYIFNQDKYMPPPQNNLPYVNKLR